MSLSLGNESDFSQVPASTTYTHSHNNNGDYLIVILGFTSLGTFGGTVSTVTYNGVTMSELQQDIININSGKLAFFELESPASGANDVVITFATSFAGAVAGSIISFNNGQSGGNSEINTGDTTPTEPSFTISQDSIVIGISASNFNTSSIELPQGTSRTIINGGNHGYYGGELFVAVSPSLNSGTATYEANTTGGSASLSLIEVQAGAAPPARRRMAIIT